MRRLHGATLHGAGEPLRSTHVQPRPPHPPVLHHAAVPARLHVQRDPLPLLFAVVPVLVILEVKLDARAFDDVHDLVVMVVVRVCRRS